MIDHDVVQAYQAKFGSVPAIMGLSDEKQAKANRLLEDAIDTDKPYETDADWYAALGVTPPPPDADI